jgi:general secretion pathway protein L
MELVRKFFRWWFDELAGLVPASLRQKMSGYRVLIVLTIQGEIGHLTLERGSQSTPLMSFDLNDASVDAVRGDLKARLGSIRRKYFGRQAVLQLQLPAACALTNTITLPRAAEENLHEVIVFELDRYTPFTAAEAYCAYQKLAQRADAAQLKVLVSVVQRGVADATLARARELGFEPDRIVVDTGKDAPAVLDLLMEDTAERSYDLLRPIRFALVGTAAGLVVAAAVLPLWHVRAALDNDQQRLAEVKRHADEAARLQREIDALQADASVLVQRKRQLLPTTQLLAELTHLLPDDTWLLELQTTGGDVQFQGFSVSASSLIALLEGSKVLRKATFRSPITPDPVTARERFQISAQMVQAGDQ